MAIQDSHQLILGTSPGVNKKVTVTDLFTSQKGMMSMASKWGLGTLNPNPTFEGGSFDYTSWINQDPANKQIVTDTVYNSSNALYFKGYSYPGSLISDNYYPIDVDREYRATISTRFNVSGSGVKADYNYLTYVYFGVVCSDSDKQSIYPHHLTDDKNLSGNSTQTYLAAPLNNGDTQVIVEDASGWYTGITTSRHVLLLHRKQTDGSYRYTGVNGRKYDHLGYSREHMYYATSLTASDYVNNGNGTWTVQLQSAWTGGNFATGDAIRNAYGGGTYMYWISNYPIPANTPNNIWTTYSSAWTVNTTDITNAVSLFRNGTAYIQLMSLPQYKIAERLKNSTDVWTDLGHDTPTIFREQWFSKLALEWRHKP